ncbi:hypothetical protein KM043_012403 [Ampulex compressa]|nr:hypothetical protein KM043_012403 [Ampulex compressa]
MKRKSKESNSEPKAKKLKKVIQAKNNIKETVEDVDKNGGGKGKKRKYEKPLSKGKKVHKRDEIEKTSSDKEKQKPKALLKKNSAQVEKPDWVEFKKQKKELKEKRKAKKLTNVYDITLKAKQISEKLRRLDCTLEERKKLVLELHELLKNHYNKMIFSHDMSRIIQCMLKYSEESVKKAVLSELKPSLLSMLESKYAKNCIKVILKHGSQEVKNEIISICYGNIVKLLCHSVSASIINLMYTTCTSEENKIFFKQEFYGDMYKQAKDKNIKSLADVFNTATDMKTATLSAVKGNLLRILNKKLINSLLVQDVLQEFLVNCSVEDRGEIIVMLRSSIAELAATKVGAKVAAICIWHGNNKDRKFILKALKDKVKTICTSEYGYLVMLALLDSVDDTVLVKKIILSEIQKDLTDIALNEYGRHVILYLVARRNSHYFPPSIVQLLQQGDGNAFSKKPADIRERELLEAIAETLLDAIAADAQAWMSNASIAMVTLAILKVGTGEKLKQVFQTLAEFVTDNTIKIKEDTAEYDVIEHSGLHLMFKKLIQYDKELCEKGESTFGEILSERLNPEILEKWVKHNRGCFLLIFLLENESKATVNALRVKLKSVLKVLESKSSPGASILLKKIKSK